MFACLGGQPDFNETQPGLRIKLENPTANFVAGQTIIGEVVLITDHTKELKNIRIKISGKARVHWSETVGSGRSSRLQNYIAEDIYFAQECKLLWSENGTVTLPSGVHGYPFSYKLPVGIPSSFKHSIGNVTYFLEAVMKRLWYKRDVSVTLPFRVQGCLNTADFNYPVTIDKRVHIFDLFCRPGAVGFVVTVTRTGFVARDFINFSVDIENTSKQNLKPMRAKLMQFTTFRANGICKKEVVEIARVKSTLRILPENEIVWACQNELAIPPVPPTNLGGCRIIDVQYALRFELKLPLCWTTIFRDIELKIGTVPIENGTEFISGFAVQSAFNSQLSQNPNYLGTSSPTNYNYLSPSTVRDHSVPLLPPSPTSSAPPPWTDTFDDDNETLPPPYEDAIEMQRFSSGKHTNEEN